jgi:hypothetical protein
MASPWTTDRVLSLAPDSASSSAGQALGSPSKWKSLGRSDRAIWGLCQGSGKDPYQARIDLSEPAFKCSCPSRKFPCKHGLGLLLCFAKGESSFKQESEPGWVSDWLATRGDRAEKKAEKAAATAEKPVDLESQAARQAKREARVKDGVEECRVWLEDLARRGLAAAQAEPQSFWEKPAARMVDAQAPGLANAIRRIGEAVSSGEGWHERTLDLMGKLYLLLAAADKLDSLPPDLAGDTRVALGWTQSKEEALAQPAAADRWVVLGQVLEEEDRLRLRRSWLMGRNSRRPALVLDFAAGSQPFDGSLVPGTEFDGEVVFYPSRLPLRALVKARGATTSSVAPCGPGFGHATCEQALGAYAAALGQVPWLARWPMLLESVKPAMRGDRALLVDASGRGLPISKRYTELWRLISVSGGRAMNVMGEWDGESLLPLAALPSTVISGVPASGVESRFEDLAPRWAA